jgi:alpha/beta superfamily hydrolase
MWSPSQDQKLNAAYDGVTRERSTFSLPNPEGLELHCTYLRELAGKPRPVLVYLHGNGGNKSEGEGWIGETCFQYGMDLFTFDFSSCGNGDGEWVTMGLKEKEDLKTVVAWLSNDQNVSGVMIWGRSMGAATAIMAMPEIKSSKLKGAILDSPFASLDSFKDNLI